MRGTMALSTQSDILPVLQKVNAQATLKGSGKFVGAVYDTTSPQGSHPIVLVIGVNFGQVGTSGNLVGAVVSKENYAPKVKVLLNNTEHHTVLWNFFPFLTQREWLEDVKHSSAEEARRIYDQGFEDPIGEFVRLFEALQPDAIIFHGIRSCVPLLARTAIRAIGPGKEAMLMPNLSRYPSVSKMTWIS